MSRREGAFSFWFVCCTAPAPNPSGGTSVPPTLFFSHFFSGLCLPTPSRDFITSAANVHFYTQVMGLRLVTQTVNQDDPSSYHLFYGDETGTPGTDLTFFDVPRAREQQPGTGLTDP